MKKIVALVLCLALALSLCTVAFAATGKVAGINSDYEIKGVIDTKEAKAPVYKDKTVKTYGNVEYYAVKFTADGKGTDANSSNFAKDGWAYFVAADTDAQYNLTIGSGSPVRVKKVDDLETLKYAYAANKVTDVNNETCGSITDSTEKASYATYVDVKGNTHIVKAGDAGKTNDYTRTYNVLLDGKVKSVTEVRKGSGTNDDTYVGHIWELVDADDDAEFDSTELVKCSECGATSKVYDYNTAAITGTIFETVGSSAAPVPASKFAAATYGWMTGASAGNNSSSTVESAKTFDAGIALYAGMALASVAGSAVVIGKKKEF